MNGNVSGNVNNDVCSRLGVQGVANVDTHFSLHVAKHVDAHMLPGRVRRWLC